MPLRTSAQFYEQRTLLLELIFFIKYRRSHYLVSFIALLLPYMAIKPIMLRLAKNGLTNPQRYKKGIYGKIAGKGRFNIDLTFRTLIW